MHRPAHAFRTSLLCLLGIVAAAFAVFAPSATAGSYSTSSYAARLLSLVNGARADHGLPALRLASGTTTVAANWTAQMSGSDRLAHNPDLRHQVETHGSPDWSIYGENVGHGGSSDPDDLVRAYMKSPEHRDNILTGAYRYVGVAVVFDGPVAWNTFDFVDTYGTPAPSREPARHRQAAHRSSTSDHPAHSVTPRAQAASSPAPAAATAPVAAAAPTHITHAAAHHQQGTHQQPAHRHQTSRHHDTTRQQHAGGHHVTASARQAHVQGLRHVASHRRSGVVAVSLSSAQPLLPLPANRSSRAVLVAVAVLALAAAARRWTLTVVRV